METSDTVRYYADDAIDISHDAHRCIRAAECIHGLQVVFDNIRPAVDRALRGQR